MSTNGVRSARCAGSQTCLAHCIARCGCCCTCCTYNYGGTVDWSNCGFVNDFTRRGLCKVCYTCSSYQMATARSRFRSLANEFCKLLMGDRRIVDFVNLFRRIGLNYKIPEWILGVSYVNSEYGNLNLTFCDSLPQQFFTLDDVS